MHTSSDKPKGGFDQPREVWNSRFDTPDFLFGEAPNAYLVSQRHLLQPGLALAIADGEGRNSVWLAEQGCRVDAFDISDVAIEKAQRFAHRRGVSVNFQCCGYEAFSWRPAHYDMVVGIFFQFATPTMRTELFEKMAASLKPGGLVVIQGYTAKQLEYKTGGPNKLDHLYDEQMIREGFPAFTWLDLRCYEAQLSEGTGHSGMSALLGAVGRSPSI